MDFYIAALGRSGSTALANFLTTPPDHVVFHEPGLSRTAPTRLFHLQLQDWGIAQEQAFDRHWAAKETQVSMHRAMVERFRPAKVILGVRRVRDAALSLLEKHRRQGLLARYDDRWTADYLWEETKGMVAFAEEMGRAGVPTLVVRYEEFGETMLRGVADWVGWPGGGDMARGFERFDRAFEMDRGRSRDLPAELVSLADRVAAECGAFERAFYA